MGHTIPVEPGKAPPFRSLYRLSPAEYDEAKQQNEDYLKKGWIEPSASPYGAPILFVNRRAYVYACVSTIAPQKRSKLITDLLCLALRI
ncbi:unnamed protein product, partial [Closterium sp. NIES-54]